MAPRIAPSLVALLGVTLAGSAARGQSFVPGTFQLTQYWIAEEQADETGRPQPVVDRRGNTLAWSCARFVSSLTMEGTGRTWDGRLLNWDARVNGRACFVEVDAALYPFGVGVQGYALVPFRSLAVDARYVPLGHTVELPELAGMPLPDGTRHDGCFVAVDGGGAIVGHHLDLFLPSTRWWRDLRNAGHLPRQVSVVIDPPRCAPARRFAIRPTPWAPGGDARDVAL